MSRQFLGSASIYTLSNIIKAAIPFLLLPLLTRILGPTDYGTVAMFTTTVTVLGAFTGLNAHGAIGIRYFEQESIHLAGYIKTALVVISISTFAVCMVLWAGVDSFRRYTGLPGQWLLVAALMSGAQFVIQIQLALWQAEGKPLRYGGLRIMQSLLDAGLSLIFVFALGYMWQGRASGQAIALLVVAASTLVLLYRAGWLSGGISRQYAENLLRFGIPLVPHTIGGLVIALVDRYMVSNLLGIASTGIYMAGLQLGMAMGLIADAFEKAFGPWLNQQLKTNDETSKYRVVGAVYFSFAAFVVLAFLVNAGMLLVFDAVLPKNYADARTVLPYFVIGNTFLGMYYAITGLIFFSSQTYRISKITVAVGALSVPMTYFLIRVCGIQGAGISFAVSQFLIFVLAWRESTKLFVLPWNRVRQSLNVILGRS